MPIVEGKNALEPEAPLAVVAENVSKIYADSFDGARLDIARALLRGGRRRPTLERGEFFAVRDVSFQVPAGSTLVVFGTRASGKSTLARQLCGVLHVDRGRVVLQGRAQYIAGARVGGNAFMKVQEYVDLVATLAGVSADRIAEVREDVLDFCSLADQRKRVLGDVQPYLARMISLNASLHTDAEILVFDDVMGGRGAMAVRWQARVAKRLETRTGVIFTGSSAAPPQAADQAVVLHDGRILYYGSPGDAGVVFQELQAELAGKATFTPMTAARRKMRARLAPNLDVLREVGTAPRFQYGTRSLGEFDPQDRTDDDAQAPGGTSQLRRRLTLESDAWAPSLLEDEIARLSSSGRPVIAGPWLGGEGGELLYWIPFLLWATSEGGIAKSRIVALTDGGAPDWYQHAAQRALTLDEVLAPEALAEHRRALSTLGASPKQRSPTRHEQSIIAAAAAALGLESFDALHPLYLYRLFWPAWGRRIPMAAALRYGRVEPLVLPAPQGLDWLPQPFVAVRFETCPFFPESRETKAFVTRQVASLAARTHVVLLAGSARDWDLPQTPRIHCLDEHETRGCRRAAAETAIIARASAFVGTFSGMSPVAPYVGTPALVFYHSAYGGLMRHVEAAALAFGSTTPYVSADAAAEPWATGKDSLVWDWAQRWLR